ncbi:MAG: hypothetical protein QOI98_280 [Solirubrobacteraceae bacterium]|nr:hypothetical protein [Solirubrobacteraceae bacterium]
MVAVEANRRVLVVLHDVEMNGATLSVLKIAPELAERGWELSYWCSRPSPQYDELVAEGLPVDGAPRLLRYSWHTLRHPPGVRARLASLPLSLNAFRRHVRDLRPALVHANTLHCLSEALVARARGVPVLVHSHEMPPPGVKAWLARTATWAAAREVVAPSRASAAALERRSSRPRVVHEPAVVPEAIEAHTPNGPAVVGSIGVISRRKGSDVFVAAAERLLAARPDVEVHLVGGIEDGPDAEWSRALVQRARDAGIRYRERVDVLDEFRAWDVLVMPSRLDPFPLVVLEAMGSGLAVVGTAVDGIVEQLEGGAGVLVASEDSTAIADALVALVDDPARRAQLGAAARERVLEHFTPDKSAAGIDAAYRGALRRP